MQRTQEMKPMNGASATVAPLRGAAHADDHEELIVERGRRSGLAMAIAVHSTLLGPALGGVRLWRYLREEDGIQDALRLARGMTYKAAAAGLDLGGGKGVICASSAGQPTGRERRAILEDFGDLVASLEGRYVTAEDVGTTPEDMVAISSRTRYVTGLPVERGGAGDPSPYTAIGVQAAMRAAAKATFGTPDLAGRRVVIVGLGHVGERLARGLAEAGATIAAADVDPAKRAVAVSLGAAWLEPDRAVEAECDILSPCAVGGAVHDGNIDGLRCRIVCGAANNQLSEEGLADILAAREILYAPDFIANAGGLINVYRELRSYPADRAARLALGIEATMARVLARAESEGRTPLDAARAMAQRRLDQAVRSARLTV